MKGMTAFQKNLLTVGIAVAAYEVTTKVVVPKVCETVEKIKVKSKIIRDGKSKEPNAKTVKFRKVKEA